MESHLSMTTETSNARGEWVLVPRVPTEAMIEAGNAAAHAGGCDLWQLKREVMNAWPAMLAAAPPPAAARGDVRGLVAKWREQAALCVDPDPGVQVAGVALESCADELESALAAEGVQAGEVHPDDAAVDAFAAAMKEKLAAARAKGRGGWNGDEPGMQQSLSDMLRAHVEKGDPRDVANFCMFLHQRGEAILSQQPEARGVVDGWRLVVRYGEYDSEPGVWAEKDGSYVWIAALTGDRDG